MSWVVWITGLPGSGKSTVALALKEKFPDTVILRMDELQRIVTPEPTYSDTEREHVYRALVFTAKTLNALGHKVIIDATGNKKSWRAIARELIPHFYEIYLKCPLELCIEREMTRFHTHTAPKDLYKKGKAGWPVPGLNVPYEEPEEPEIVIDTERESPDIAVKKIITMLAE